MADLKKIFNYIDENQETYIERLADSVAIQSVSAWPEKRGECRRMMEVTAQQMKNELGCKVELIELGEFLHIQSFLLFQFKEMFLTNFYSLVLQVTDKHKEFYVT